MTDLVQKIAKDACRILGYSMVDSIVHEKLREAICQALAQSGEAVCYGCSVGMRLCDDGLHRDPLGQVFPHTATIAYPAPSADRVAELEAQLVAEYGLSERWRQRTLAAEKQLAESEKKREAVTSDWSKLGAKLGLLQMQLGATERQLAESRERVARAYGLLWHVNAGIDAPWGTPSLTPERAAMESRKVLRDMLTNEHRGDGINAARDIMKALAAKQGKNDE